MGAPRSFPEHWHEFAEFIIATDNNGSYSVGNEQYLLDTGDLLLIWPGEMHSNISLTSKSSLLLQFCDNFIYNCLELMNFFSIFITRHLSVSPVFFHKFFNKFAELKQPEPPEKISPISVASEQGLDTSA